MKNIVIYWMRWTWKSSIWKILSKKIGKNFIDLDFYIVQKLWQDLSSFIKMNWWDEFRNIEYKYLNEILNNVNNSIISLWWGTITFERNQEIILQNNPILIYIYSDINSIVSRINIDEKLWKKRTSLTWKSLIQELNEVYESRKNIYEKFYNLKINNEWDIDNSLTLITEYLNNIDKYEK